jgi:flagellar capping protein FliD
LWDTKGQLQASQKLFSQFDSQLQKVVGRLTQIAADPQPKGESREEFRLKQENREMSKQLDLERENHNRQLQQMDQTMTELRIQNSDLRQKLDKQHSEFRSKSLQL